MGILGFPFLRNFRDPVVIIRTPSACKRYGDRDDAYDAGGYSHADAKTYRLSLKWQIQSQSQILISPAKKAATPKFDL